MPAVIVSLESNHVSTRAVLLSMSTADQKFLQPDVYGDYNDSKPQDALFEVTEMFTQDIMLMNIPWPLISNNKFWIVDESWILAIEA